MASGFKIADAWIEVHLDDSTAKREVSQLPQRIGSDTDRAGTSVGRRMGRAVGRGLDLEATTAGKSAGEKISRGVKQSINGGRFGEALRKQVDSAIKSLPQTNLLNLDVGSTAELDRLRRELESLSSKRIGVDLSAEDASAKIGELERQLTELGSRSANIQVKVDTAAAAAELAAFRTKIAKAGDGAGGDFAASLDRALGPAMKRSADEAGGTLAQGMRQSVVRNSPLIVAGVGAALAAGAPVAIAGATTLFAGIGIAAAAMNDQVQKVWGDTWSGLVTGTKADASILQTTVANMALQVSAAFTQMRPLMQDAFTALGPIIEQFTGSLLKAAQNALPGLVHAIQASGPVMDGLGSLVERIGTGLGQFFDIISQHSAAAGKAFDAIGRIVGALLPILGQFLAQGVELASRVLPPLASILEVVADALGSVAPALGAVASGFLAFKVVSSLSGPLASFSNSLSNLAGKNLPGISAAAGGAASGLSKFGAALPVIGIALGLASAAMSAHAESADKVQGVMEGLYTSLRTGGAEAAHAQELLALAAKNGGDGVAEAMTKGKAASDAYWASLTPLQQAQAVATAAEKELADAVRDHGASSLQANEALQRYNDATAAAAAEQAALELAVEGVTEAMVAQANQALAAASSQFAYDNAVNQVSDAQRSLSEAIRDHGSASEEAGDATRSLNEALLSQAVAAGQLASDALPATASELDRNQVAASATLQELYRLRDAMGTQFPAALQQAITGLENSGAATTNFSAQAQQAKTSVINLITQAGLLGQQHPVPTADLQTSGFAASWSAAMSNVVTLANQRPTPVAGLTLNPFQAGFSGVMGNIATLAGQRPTPVAGLNDQASAPVSRLDAAVVSLGGRRPTPVASVVDNASGPLSGILSRINALYSKTIYITTVQRTVSNILGGLGSVNGGAVNDIPVIKAASGRVVGPGTGTSDSVPAIGPNGQRWALSNGEWVVRDAAVRALERAYGPSAMPTINSGRLPVATNSGTSGSMAKVQGGAVGHTYNVTVNVNGVGFADSELPRRLVTVISDALRKRDRELS